ncbi:MAG: hypothetical protein ACOCQG_04780 [Candidatus Nanoarchaeia archaeon]
MYAKRILPYSFRYKWGKFLDKVTLKEAKDKPIDPQFKKQLMKRFKPEVVKLNKLLHKYKMTDEDLVKFWGYDKV